MVSLLLFTWANADSAQIVWRVWLKVDCHPLKKLHLFLKTTEWVSIGLFILIHQKLNYHPSITSETLSLHLFLWTVVKSLKTPIFASYVWRFLVTFLGTNRLLLLLSMRLGKLVWFTSPWCCLIHGRCSDELY